VNLNMLRISEWRKNPRTPPNDVSVTLPGGQLPGNLPGPLLETPASREQLPSSPGHASWPVGENVPINATFSLAQAKSNAWLLI
jgi:hypothetical protein